MTSPELAGIRSLAARGLIVTGIAQAWRIIVTLISSVVLTRLLTPADFGLFAAVSACLAFVSLIQDLGLNQATIQRPTISRAQISALFWISTALSILLAIALYCSAPAVAWFFGDHRIEGLTMACSTLLVLGAIQSQHVALLNRELRYKALAAIDILSSTLSVGVGIAIASLTMSYWALFAATLTGILLSGIGAWTFSRWRPTRPDFEGHFSEIFHFGAGASGFNIVNYFARNADNLLIGRYYGPEELGLYDRAYRLLIFPLQQFMLPLGRIMFPLLSRLQANPERYRKAYLESVSLLMIATQPGLAFAIVFADDLFLILFGPHWVPAAQIFRWLGVAGLLQVMNSPTGWLYLSQGRAGEFFKIGLYSSVATVLSFVAGLPWGAIGVAIAYTITEYLVRLPVAWSVIGRTGPVSTFDLFAMAFPHALATILTASTLWSLSRFIETPGILGCICLGFASYSIYLLSLIAFPLKRQLLISYAVTIMKLRRGK